MFNLISKLLSFSVSIIVFLSFIGICSNIFGTSKEDSDNKMSLQTDRIKIRNNINKLIGVNIDTVVEKVTKAVETAFSDSPEDLEETIDKEETITVNEKTSVPVVPVNNLFSVNTDRFEDR